MRVFLFLVVAVSFLNCRNDSVFHYCPSTEICIKDTEGNVKLIEYGNPEYDILNQGICQTGKVVCLPEDKIVCKGYIPPSEEICDKLDNDCDGQIDEGFDLDNDNFSVCDDDCNDNNNKIYPGAPEICDGLDNDCNQPRSFIDIDSDGDSFAPCEGDCDDTNPNIHPNASEICNAIDDDCNNLIDDNIELYQCGPEIDTGTCSYGEEVCIQGESLCLDAQYPQTEACDNLDNDCDGEVDEDLFQPCQNECGQGIETCNNGNWTGCTAQRPSPELCNNIDDNCDGVIDENCPCVLGDTQTCLESPMYDINTNNALHYPYPCGEGVKICDINGVWSNCYFLRAIPESCNAWDDDCDGIVDQIYIPCSGYPQLAGMGECRSGQSYCEMGFYGTCENQVLPQSEICDNLDNNCNGEIDEGLDTHEKVDLLFIVDISGSMRDYIDALAEAIRTYVSDFANTEHRFALVTTPGRVLSYDDYEVRTGIPGNMLVDVNTFNYELNNLLVNGYGAIEPTYDASYDACSSSDLIGVNWRDDAHPYIIMLTDETPQSVHGRNQSDVSIRCTDCRVGSCETGDTYSFFVITDLSYSSMWIDIVNSDPNNIKDININDTALYVNMLRDIFSDLCR